MQALPEDVKAGCEDPGSSYSFGWSHGREAMAEGTPDTMKGSYYGNPLQDNRDVGEELAAQFPSYCRCRRFAGGMPGLCCHTACSEWAAMGMCRPIVEAAYCARGM